MSSGSVAQLEELLKDQPTNPLRPNQLAHHQEEMERNRAIAESPPFVNADRGMARRRYLEHKHTLDTQGPKPIEDVANRNEVYRLANDVLQNVIRPTMLPRSVMRRNPAGAVDAHLKGEASKATKRAIRMWKRAMWALDPTTTDTDHTNLEKWRPEGTPEGGTASFMVDGQIPGNFAMTPQAKENWPLGEPATKTAVSHMPPVEVEDPPPAMRPAILCECGCNKTFVPKHGRVKYLNKRHRDKDYAKKRRIAEEGGEVGGSSHDPN